MRMKSLPSYIFLQYDIFRFFSERKTSNTGRLAGLDRRESCRMILRAIAETGSFTHYTYIPRTSPAIRFLSRRLSPSHSDLRGHGWPVLALTAVRERESKQQIEVTAAGKAPTLLTVASRALSFSLRHRNRNPSSPTYE